MRVSLVYDSICLEFSYIFWTRVGLSKIIRSTKTIEGIQLLFINIVIL